MQLTEMKINQQQKQQPIEQIHVQQTMREEKEEKIRAATAAPSLQPANDFQTTTKICIQKYFAKQKMSFKLRKELFITIKVAKDQQTINNRATTTAHIYTHTRENLGLRLNWHPQNGNKNTIK